jgi:hypothetical protein
MAVRRLEGAMQPLTIAPSEVAASPGDLHAHVSDGELRVPTHFAQAMREQGVRTAADLLELMQSFPTSIATVLSWPVSDVYRATEILRGQLEGLIPDQVLNQKTLPNPAFGAQSPGDLPPLKRESGLKLQSVSPETQSKFVDNGPRTPDVDRPTTVRTRKRSLFRSD